MIDATLRLFFLGSLVGCQSLVCGPGTIEADGQCIVGDTDPDTDPDTNGSQDAEPDGPAHGDLTAVLVYPCWSPDATVGSHGQFWVDDADGERLASARWEQGQKRPVGFTWPSGEHTLGWDYYMWGPDWSSSSGRRTTVHDFAPGTLRRWRFCENSYFTLDVDDLIDGQDFHTRRVWVEFESGIDASYAETLLDGAGYTIVTRVRVEPPGFIAWSNEGLWSPAATLDIVARIPRVDFAEPLPL